MIPKVRFRIYSGFYNEFLNNICENNIPIFDIQSEKLGVTAVCYARDYKKIVKFRRKYQCKIRIIQKIGPWFRLSELTGRKGLLAGVFTFLLLVYAFSLIVWDIRIDTTDQTLKNEIISQLYERSIYPGIVATKERLEMAEKHILSANNRIKYISLNFYKGVLECKINMKTEKEDYLSGMSEGDIYAGLSGIVSDLRVYDGYCHIELGQSVSEGDILVSSHYIDKHGNEYYSKTRAYIEAICDKSYVIQIPFNKSVQMLTGNRYEEKTLHFMGKEFVLKSSLQGADENSLKRIQLEYITVLGFHLPACIKTTVYYQIENMVIKMDSLTARKIAQLQLEHMIMADTKLKQEIARQYEYAVSDTALTVFCHINGLYEIT